MTNSSERPVLTCCKLLNLLRKMGSEESGCGPPLAPDRVLHELEEEFEAHSRLEEALHLSVLTDSGAAAPCGCSENYCEQEAVAAAALETARAQSRRP